jgi:hypothetical protein
MSNPLVNRWRQRGNVYLWRFDDHVRNDPGWNFTADEDGCASLLELLTLMADDDRTARVAIQLSKPSDDIQRLGLGVGTGKLRAPRHFTLEYPPTKVPPGFWQWTGTFRDPRLKLGRGKLIELISAVADVRQGIGDFEIGAADQKQHGFDFAKMSIWFW